MKRAFLLFLFALLALSPALAQSAEPKRILVFAFSTEGSAKPYGVGLAVGLERSLNVLDGLFIPPIGDTVAVITQLQQQCQLGDDGASGGASGGTQPCQLTPDKVAEFFGAQVIVSGKVSASGAQVKVLLGFSGPAYPDAKDVTIKGNLTDPAAVVGKVVNAVLSELKLSAVGSEHQQLQSVIAETPSLPSLQAAASASLRLQSPDMSALNAAASLDKDSSWVLSELARGQALQGDLKSAQATALQAVKAGPDDISARTIQGIVLLAAGDDKGALNAFNAALKLNPDYAPALEGKGRASSDPKQAEAAYEAAIAAYPQYTQAYLDLADLQAKTSGQRALQTLRQGTEQNPYAIRLYSAFMQETVKLGDPGGALAYLKQTLAEQQHPLPELYALAAGLPDSLGDQALAIVKEGLKAYPQSDVLALADASLESKKGDYAAAEAALKTGLAANPDNLDIINRLAIAQATQGEFDAAQKTLEGAPGDNPTLQTNLANVYLQAGQAGAAVKVLKPLLAKSPKDAQLHTLYGIALGRSGQFDAALSELNQALELEHKNQQAKDAEDAIKQQQQLTQGKKLAELSPEANTAFQKGLAALEKRDFSTAANDFAQARKAQDTGLLAFYQGYALQNMGQNREAIDAYQDALKDKNLAGSDVILNDLAAAYFSIGRYDEALTYSRQAVKANSENAQAQLNLGLLYAQLGRNQDALGPLSQALKLKPEWGKGKKIQRGGGEPVTLQAFVKQLEGQGK